MLHLLFLKTLLDSFGRFVNKSKFKKNLRYTTIFLGILAYNFFYLHAMCCVKKNRWKSVPNTLKTNMRTYGPSPRSETACIKYHPKINKAEKKIKFITVFSQVWNKKGIDKLNIGRWFHEKGHWYEEKCHDLSQIRPLELKKYYRKIGSETEVIRSLNLSIQLILIHLLAVSHRFEQLQCKSDVQKHFSNDLYAFWMISIKTWFRLTTWGAGSPVELETFIITTRSNQPHSWAWESCETKTR